MRNKYRWWGNQVIRGKVFRPNSERLVNPVLELNRLQARLDAVRPIAEEMINPECPENEAADCEICQSYIRWGKAILAALEQKDGRD